MERRRSPTRGRERPDAANTSKLALPTNSPPRSPASERSLRPQADTTALSPTLSANPQRDALAKPVRKRHSTAAGASHHTAKPANPTTRAAASTDPHPSPSRQTPTSDPYCKIRTSARSGINFFSSNSNQPSLVPACGISVCNVGTTPPQREADPSHTSFCARVPDNGIRTENGLRA